MRPLPVRRTFQFNYLNFPAGTVPVTHVRPDEAR
jgi:hypothetical protein